MTTGMIVRVSMMMTMNRRRYGRIIIMPMMIRWLKQEAMSKLLPLWRRRNLPRKISAGSREASTSRASRYWGLGRRSSVVMWLIITGGARIVAVKARPRL